jgi:hypothetical protein
VCGHDPHGIGLQGRCDLVEVEIEGLGRADHREECREPERPVNLRTSGRKGEE